MIVGDGGGRARAGAGDDGLSDLVAGECWCGDFGVNAEEVLAIVARGISGRAGVAMRCFGRLVGVRWAVEGVEGHYGGVFER